MNCINIIIINILSIGVITIISIFSTVISIIINTTNVANFDIIIIVRWPICLLLLLYGYLCYYHTHITSMDFVICMVAFGLCINGIF